MSKKQENIKVIIIEIYTKCQDCECNTKLPQSSKIPISINNLTDVAKERKKLRNGKR